MGFECQDYFMIRTPGLPVKYLKKYESQEKDIYEFIRSDDKLDVFFRKALLISSKSLYYSYINKPDNVKKYNNLKDSLLKYFIRSVIRTTPYGYFAGVSMSKFSNETKLVKNKSLIDLKVDNEWINSLIYILEREEVILKKLKFQFNKLCYISGDRFKNPYFTNNGKAKKNEKIVEENNIKYTNLIGLIKDKANSFISYEDLKKEILQSYPGAPEKLVENTIKMLMENEYLFSNLRIPSYCKENLNHVIKVLEDINYKGKYLEQLRLVRNLIEEYKKEEKIKTLENIYHSMANLCKNKNYLNLNLGNEFRYNNLTKDVKIRIERLADLLYKIPVKMNSIHTFKEKFIERYGLNVEVPLIKIIDKNDFNGLSFLDTNLIDNTKDETKINNIINNKIFKSILNGESEVYFTSKDFKDIDQTEVNFPKSFDINILITLLNEKYNLYLGPNIGSNKAGSMFQRFSECFNSKELGEYNKIYKKEEELYKNEYLLVEVRELFCYGNQSNVINNNKNYRYFISFGNCYEEYDNEITINDIYVGVSNSAKIYIKSRKHNKKIKIITDNMLNPNLNNNIIKLLKYICETYEEYPENRLSSLITNLNYKYIPRIYFEDIIVSPRKWIIDKTDIKSTNYEEFKKQLKLNQMIYKMDSVLYITCFDNRIIVNLDKDEYIRILYAEFKKSKKLEFNEVEKGLLEGTIVKDLRDNEYVNECIFSIIKVNNKQNQKQLSFKNNIILADENRNFLLCEDGWIYFKLYGVDNRENEILTIFLHQLLKDLNNVDHFFLRYADDKGSHLRIRIKFENEKRANEKLPQIIQWVRELMNKKVANSIIFDVYEREINRYGGKEIIESCEKVFFQDSITVEKILSKYDLTLKNNIEKIYIFGIVSILKNLTKDINEMFLIIDTCKFNNIYRHQYREKHKQYIRFIQDLLDEKVEKYLDIYPEFLEEKKVLNQFQKKMDKQFLNNRNTNDKVSIILSIIHMYCNRVTGKREYENKYLEITRNSLYHIIKMKKYCNNKISSKRLDT
ncbi:hypothetical protein FDF74_03855 [Clostridium niameyense]|uniref:Lantibiotic dehydratase n=1 Tax=Clostridium niameyense TaxID=1622073 RepID=A0A6M0R7Y4_9CLOT|nr:lantibiotic dehydratase [Clostridium niameyense]NEZ46346.1 hypothetical protein [Clostridium niameyense]